MTTGKTCTALVFLALLSGCGSKPCPRPGDVVKLYSEGPIHSCLYQLYVTEIDLDNYLIKAKLPDTVKQVAIEQRYKAEAERQNYEQKEVKIKTKDELYIFRVRDLDKLVDKTPYGIKKDGIYYFLRDGHSPYLEHFPTDPKVDE